MLAECCELTTVVAGQRPPGEHEHPDPEAPRGGEEYAVGHDGQRPGREGCHHHGDEGCTTGSTQVVQAGSQVGHSLGAVQPTRPQRGVVAAQGPEDALRPCGAPGEVAPHAGPGEGEHHRLVVVGGTPPGPVGTQGEPVGGRAGARGDPAQAVEGRPPHDPTRTTPVRSAVMGLSGLNHREEVRELPRGAVVFPTGRAVYGLPALGEPHRGIGEVAAELLDEVGQRHVVAVQHGHEVTIEVLQGCIEVLLRCAVRAGRGDQVYGVGLGGEFSELRSSDRVESNRPVRPPDGGAGVQ